MKQKPKQRKRRHTTATKSKAVKGGGRRVKQLVQKREPWRTPKESLSVTAKSEGSNI